MPAPIRELADALLPVVNAFVAAPALGATRKYLAQIELKSLTGRQCFVVPREDKTTGKADRHRWNHELIIDVALVGKLDDIENATADVLLDLADALCEYLKANRVISGRPEKLMNATLQALWEPDKFKDQHVFSTAVQLDFADIR